MNNIENTVKLLLEQKKELIFLETQLDEIFQTKGKTLAIKDAEPRLAVLFEKYQRLLSQHERLKQSLIEPPVKFKRLNENVPLPVRAYGKGCGYDLAVISKNTIISFDGVAAKSLNEAVSWFEYHTGIFVKIPEGYYGRLVLRSSSRRIDEIMTNHVGTIENDYRGEIVFCTKPLYEPILSEKQQGKYKVGDRIGQLIIQPYNQFEWVEVDELSTSERGDKGFGSTGK